MARHPIASPISTGALVLRYAGFLVAGVVLLNLALAVLPYKFNSGGMSAIGVFLIWGAASWVGQMWFGREQAWPTSGRVWTVAALCALVTYLVQAMFVLLAAGGALNEFGTLGLRRGRDEMIIAGFFAIVALLELLIIRVAIGVGARAADKKAQRQAAKAGA